MLVRLITARVTSWDQTEEMIKNTEFKKDDGSYDLSPSVYSVEDPEEQLVRLVAERASCRCTPKFSRALQARAASSTRFQVEEKPTNDHFQFVRETHREVRIPASEDILEFIRELRAKNIERPGDLLKDYVRNKLSAGDQEWLAVLKLNPEKWVEKIARSCNLSG